MEKIKVWETEIESLIKKISDSQNLSSWKFKQNIKNGEEVSIKDSNWEERNFPVTWSLKEGPAYFRKWIEIPPEIEKINIEGSTVDITFNFPSGVEVFIDGKKVYGHRFWADKIATPLSFLQNAKAGEKHLLVFKTPGGDGLGCFGANLSIDKVENIIFELKAILHQIYFASYVVQLEGEKNLERKLKEAIDILNLSDFKKRKWANVLTQIKEAEKKLEEFRPIAKKYKVHLAGHAHIDMNWLWTYEDTIDVCLRDFSTVVKLMEEYPDLTFSQSQCHIYKIVEEKNPLLFKKVKEKVKKGRWDVTANAWVEGDLNMAEGESLVRHILYSKKYMEEKLGTNSKIMWSPDTFGHPISIPEILSKAGIKYYYFMRCGKDLPLFRWQGRDGSEVLAFNSHYNNKIDSDTILPLFLKYYKKYRINEMLFVYGIGDHGGGPTRMDIERKKKLETKPVIPTLVFSTPEKFLSSVEKYRSKLPVVKEELNTIFEGCYTTHSDIKKANRECETSLMTLETVSSLAKIKGLHYPEKELESLWQDTLFNQFHDIMDGSAIHSSYDYSNKLADSIRGRCRNLLKKAVCSFLDAKGKENVFVFNPSGWERNGLVKFNIPPQLKKVHLEGENGEKLPVEVVGNAKAAAKVEKIPGYGYKSFLIKEGEVNSESKVVNKEEGIWENPFYLIEVDKNKGLIRRIYDKRNKREVITPCVAVREDKNSWWAETSGNLLKIYWEEPHPMSAWIIGNIYKVENLLKAENFTVKENQSSTVLRVERKYNNSSLKQKTILYPDFPFIDFELEIDWKEAGNKTIGVPMVRTNFNFNMENPRPFFEIPFGVFQRKNAPREYPSLKWAGFKEGNYMAGIINKEKYGYHVDGKNLSLTILRNPYEPDSLPDSGYHKVSYRLYFGKIDELELSRNAVDFNMPLVAETGKSKEAGEFSPIKVTGDVLATCFKKSLTGDFYILRLCEIKGKKQNCKVEFTLPCLKAYLTDICEKEEKQIEIKNSSLKLEVKPYSLTTLKLKFSIR